MKPVIKEVNESAIGEIRRIAHATWPISYKEMISADQIDYMLEMMYSENSLREQFAAGIRFLICEWGELPAGFAGAGPKNESSKIWRLEKLYVMPELQSKGIGGALLDHVIKIAKKAEASTIELNVNRNNKALIFYQRMGFEIHDSVDLPIGGGFFMNDYILHKKID